MVSKSTCLVYFGSYTETEVKDSYRKDNADPDVSKILYFHCETQADSLMKNKTADCQAFLLLGENPGFEALCFNFNYCK